MSDDLKRSFELLEVLLPDFFTGAGSIFKQNIKLNENSHATMKNTTVDILMKIPAIQAELDFYNFVRQRFELQYETFIN